MSLKRLTSKQASRKPETQLSRYNPAILERVNFFISAWGDGDRTPTVVKNFIAEYNVSKQLAYRYMQKAKAEHEQVSTRN